MTIRKKATLILTFGMGIMILVSIFLTANLFLSEIDDLEQKKAKLDIERVDEALASEIENLNSKTADWAVWDDSYKFIQDKNKEYIKSDLDNSSSFESLRLSFMVFVDRNEKVVYSKGYDQNTKEPVSIPAGINQYLNNNRLLKFNGLEDSKAGFLSLPEGLFLVSARPIITSLSEGPAMGTIVFGRKFDEVEAENLAKITKQSKIEILPIGNQKLSQFDIKVIDKNTIEGKGVIKNVFADPICYFKLNISRDIHKQGVQGVWYLVMALTIATIILFILIMYLFGKLVLYPIKYITDSVNRISHSKDLSERISLVGNDEFSSLSRDINLMLESFEMSKDRAFAEAEKVKSFFDVVSGIVVVLNRDGLVVSINKKGAELLGYLTEEVIGQNWFDRFVPKDDNELTYQVFKDILSGVDVEKHAYHENRVIDKKGNQILIGWHNSHLKDQEGVVVATVSHGEDITIKKKEEEEDKKQREELQKLNELMMGRELKMIEMKKELEELKSREVNKT